MVNRFDEEPTLYTRALQIWQILISKATNRQTLTYGELAGILEFGGASVLGRFLDPVMRYCRINELPSLTIIVVNQETGQPGTGLSAIDDHNRAREEVFNYDWFGIFPPTPAEFETAHRK